MDFKSTNSAKQKVTSLRISVNACLECRLDCPPNTQQWPSQPLPTNHLLTIPLTRPMFSPSTAELQLEIRTEMNIYTV